MRTIFIVILACSSFVFAGNGENVNVTEKPSAIRTDCEPLSFYQAIADGNLDSISMLLDCGMDPLKTKIIGVRFFELRQGRFDASITPLSFSLIMNRTDIFLFLIDKVKAINSFDGNKRTPLMLAVHKNDIELVKKLLLMGAKVNIRNTEGETALGEAVIAHDATYYNDLEKNKSLELIKYLINKGAEVNSPVLSLYPLAGCEDDDVIKVNPIMHAVARSAPELVKLLLVSGADISIKNSNGFDVLYFACEPTFGLYSYFDSREEDRSLRVVNLLLDSGADVNSKTKEGYTCLFNAVSAIMYDLVKTLIKNGANPNIKEETPFGTVTPVHEASNMLAHYKKEAKKLKGKSRPAALKNIPGTSRLEEEIKKIEKIIEIFKKHGGNKHD